MYRIDNFSDDSIFQKGFNNYALQSLIAFCSIDDGKGGFTLENYIGSRKLVVGCEKSYIDEICDIIIKNKEKFIEEFNEMYGLNTKRVLSDDMIISSLIDAIKITADDTMLTVPGIEVEYMIANSIISNDDIFRDMYIDTKDEGNLGKAVDVALTRFFGTGAEMEALRSEIIECYLDNIEDQYISLELAELLEDSFFGIDLIEQVFYDFDYEFIDTDPEIAKNMIKGQSLDSLLESKAIQDVSEKLEDKILSDNEEVR